MRIWCGKLFSASIFVLLMSLPALALQGVPNTWEELGGSATDTGLSPNSILSWNSATDVDPSGNPVVAWSESDGVAVFDIMVRRWNGTAWEEMGGSGSAGGISSSPSGMATFPIMRHDNAGNITVAWSQSLFFGAIADILLRRWNGTTWEELGGSGSAGGLTGTAGQVSGPPGLALDGSGNPIVAYAATGASGASQIFVKRWDGTAWVGIAGSDTGDGISNGTIGSVAPSVATDAAGNVYVAWQEGQLFVGNIYFRKYDVATGNWEELAGSASGLGIDGQNTWMISPAVALNSAGEPVVAWSESPIFATGNVFLREWDGSAWVEIGGSGSGQGVSNSAATSSNVRMGMGPSGPVLSWLEGTDIHLRRWDGSSWEELAGSGSGGGISNTGTAGQPSMGLSPGGDPAVAWTHTVNVGGTSEQYVHFRRWVPPLSVAGLGQFQTNGTTVIAVGAQTPETAVHLKGTVTGTVGVQVKLQVEVQPIATPFSGTMTHESSLVASGTEVTVVVSGLISPTDYHWRGRVVDSLGAQGPWVSFGGNANGQVDFNVDGSGGGSTGGGGGGVSGGGSKEDKSFCSASTGSVSTLPLLLLFLVFVGIRVKR